MLPINATVDLFAPRVGLVPITITKVAVDDVTRAFEHQWATVTPEGAVNHSIVLIGYAGQVYAPYSGSLVLTRTKNPTMDDIAHPDPFDPRRTVMPMPVAERVDGASLNLRHIPATFDDEDAALTLVTAIYDRFLIVGDTVWIRVGEPAFTLDVRAVGGSVHAGVRLRCHRGSDHPLLTYPVTARDDALAHAALLSGRLPQELLANGPRGLDYADPDFVNLPSHAWQVANWQGATAALRADGEVAAADERDGEYARLTPVVPARFKRKVIA